MRGSAEKSCCSTIKSKAFSSVYTTQCKEERQATRLEVESILIKSVSFFFLLLVLLPPQTSDERKNPTLVPPPPPSPRIGEKEVPSLFLFSCPQPPKTLTPPSSSDGRHETESSGKKEKLDPFLTSKHLFRKPFCSFFFAESFEGHFREICFFSLKKKKSCRFFQ